MTEERRSAHDIKPQNRSLALRGARLVGRASARGQSVLAACHRANHLPGCSHVTRQSRFKRETEHLRPADDPGVGADLLSF